MLIIEDEPEAEQTLCAHLERFAEEHHERFQISWLKTAFEFVQSKQKADIIFMDIQLPGINGVEAAEYLRSYDSRTVPIFVTNLAKYAVKGYEVGATGFIVKPVTWGNLSMNLDRALRVIKQNSGRSVMVPTEDGVRVVPFSSIVYIEVTGHKLTYHLESGEEIEARGSLGQVEEELDGAPIVRVAKSCLANMDKISFIRPQTLQMVTGEQLHVSRTRKREVMDAVTDYLGGRR